MKSQGDSSFPTTGHKAILNKLNTKSKAQNKPQLKHRLGTVSIKLLVGGSGGGGGSNLFCAHQWIKTANIYWLKNVPIHDILFVTLVTTGANCPRFHFHKKAYSFVYATVQFYLFFSNSAWYNFGIPRDRLRKAVE